MTTTIDKPKSDAVDVGYIAATCETAYDVATIEVGCATTTTDVGVCN